MVSLFALANLPLLFCVVILRIAKSWVLSEEAFTSFGFLASSFPFFLF